MFSNLFLFCELQADIKHQKTKRQKLAEVVSEKLGVPDETGIEYSVTEMFYWDSAERYYKNVDFTQNGEKKSRILTVNGRTRRYRGN